MVIVLIVSFIAHCGIAFLISFCYDEAKIWGNNEEPKLHRPKLEELRENEMLIVCKTDTDEDRERKIRVNDIVDYKNKQQRQKYVDDIIAPAYCYFKLKKEIECYQSANDSFMSAFFIVQPATILIIARALLGLEIANNFLVCIIIALIPCIICDWVISLVYKLTPLTINQFELNLDNLKKSSENSYNYYKENEKLVFNISKDNFVNNFIIDTHNEYLNSIKHTIIMRNNIRKIIGVIGIVVYLFFFFIIPEY